ncbi:MAG: hypothetical protein RR246_06485, partial [Clostridia bacterium]
DAAILTDDLRLCAGAYFVTAKITKTFVDSINCYLEQIPCRIKLSIILTGVNGAESVEDQNLLKQLQHLEIPVIQIQNDFGAENEK